MADVLLGRILVDLKADTAQFNNAMRGARASVQAVDPTIANLTTRFDKMGDRIYTMRDEIANTTVATGSMTKAQERLARQAFQTGQGLGTIRSTMASLTARSVALNGTMGTLFSGIAQFAAGNLIAIGVIAGIAAIAAGIKLMGKEAREARERIEGLQRQWMAMMGAGRPAVQIARELGELGEQQTTAVETLDRAQRMLNVGSLTKTRQELEQIVAEREYELALVNQLIAAKRRELTAAHARTREGPEKEAAKALDAVLERAGQIPSQVTGYFEQLRRKFVEVGAASAEMGNFTGLVTENLGRLYQHTGASDAAIASFSRTVFEAKPPLDEMHWALYVLNMDLEDVADASKGAREGADNVRSAFGEMQDEINNVLAALMTLKAALQDLKTGNWLGVFGTIGGAIAGFALSGGNPLGALAGAQAGQMVFGEPGGQGVTFNVNVGRPSNYMAMARDREWQQAFRETALVAQSQGFRFAAG